MKRQNIFKCHLPKRGITRKKMQLGAVRIFLIVAIFVRWLSFVKKNRSYAGFTALKS